jgi:hypothetical protein
MVLHVLRLLPRPYEVSGNRIAEHAALRRSQVTGKALHCFVIAGKMEGEAAFSDLENGSCLEAGSRPKPVHSFFGIAGATSAERRRLR